MTPYDFGLLVAHQFVVAEKRAEGEVHPLQSPAAGYREELFRQRQQQQQEQMAQQQQMAAQQSANLPQGPTATNYPNIAPAQGLEPHDLQGAQPAGQPKTASTSVALQIVHQALAQKSAGLAGLASAAGTLGRGALNFGKGMYAATKPITGLATGGFGGLGKGLQTAGKMMFTGGKFSPAAAAGAGLAAYGMYNSLQNPIQQTGDGFRLRSPIKIPNVRLRSPVVNDGGGVNVQNPFKVLW